MRSIRRMNGGLGLVRGKLNPAFKGRQTLSPERLWLCVGVAQKTQKLISFINCQFSTFRY